MYTANINEKCLSGAELKIAGVTDTKEFHVLARGTLWYTCNFNLVTLKTNQVETFFGELEYLEPRLKALGV